MNGKTAIDACHESLGRNHLSPALKPLSNQFRVFNIIRLRLDHTRTDELVIGDTKLLECGPLMGVSRISTLNKYRLWLGGPNNINDVADRHVVVMWPRIVPPTQVHPKLLFWNIPNCIIECLDIDGNRFAEGIEIHRRVRRVTTHSQIRTIELHRRSRIGNCLVFVAHGFSNRKDVGLMRLIKIVGKKE